MIKKNALIVIPTRLAATRLPRKPLANICEKPMIVHVWEKAKQANLGPVVIASGDKEILEALIPYGAEGVLTDPALPTGTDRVKAALDLYDPQGNFEFIINVQGDLPTLDAHLIQEVLAPFENPEVDIATLATPLTDPEEFTDPNIVKIALSLKDGGPFGRAFYFSRGAIPFGEGPAYHHIGLYAYRRAALKRFVSLPVHPLEIQERLEQLRALVDGMRIDVKIVETTAPFGVDTPADLEKARKIISQNLSKP